MTTLHPVENTTLANIYHFNYIKTNFVSKVKKYRIQTSTL